MGVKKVNIRFKVIASLVLSLSILWIFFFYWYEKKREEEALTYLVKQAEGVYKTVILARHWISSKGGIYVKNNDYMELITPSHFVAKLASFAKRMGGYSIKIAVEDPKNPEHLPDEFERRALRALTEKSSYWELQRGASGYIFRYAAPLRFRKECVHCHYDYDAKTKGCVSVTLNADDIVKVMKRDRIYMGVFSFASLSILFAVLYYLINLYVIRPLSRFVEVSERVERGDMSARVGMGAGDEWGVMAKNFNKMLDKVENVQKELEERVKEAVAELKSAYEELKKTEQYRSEFFSNITHDLKTPITAIKGVGELLLRKGDGYERYGRMLLRNGEKLLKMVDDILECTRIEYGRFELDLKPQDVCDIVKEAVGVVEPIAEIKDVKVEFDSCDKIVLCVDGRRLLRAVVNLLDNAIRHSPSGEVVRVSTFRQNGGVLISVRDRGEGVREEDREKIFDKFYKGEKGGLGLGLFVVRKVVEAHGGRVWVESGDGKGSRFCIYLPVREDACKDSARGG